ncbi:hypothetical protein ACIO6T_41295 [Streptomyces sp. NPDC087532]|uniref:hypothetical protein n=1 Tax=unclassified Streptomyces TaxID=2593676 RepID=UPI00343CCACC
MPEKPAQQHWTESLFDSVYALYETAHEYRTAHRAAQVAEQMVGMDRRQIHEGRIALQGRVNAYGRTRTREPHEKAIYDLGTLYRQAESKLHRCYEEAALLYASGAAWSIATVQDGHTPAVVEFNTDDNGDAVPHRLHIPGLDTYAEGPALDAAYNAVRDCMGAAEYAEDLAGRDYVTDHEAGEMFRAGNAALGLADAAFAYGLLAQRAVNFVLLEPRRAWHSELAAARATAQQSIQPTP